MLRLTLTVSRYTNITYVPANSSVILDRDHSTLLPDFLMTTFLGHFMPYTRADVTSDNSTSTDPLNFSIFVDGSLFEIFINDRFAMSSRTYPSLVNSTFVAFEGVGDGIVVQNITLWDTMYPVWPERPLNASSPLVFDPYCDTHVCFPNPYVAEGVEIYSGYKFV